MDHISTVMIEAARILFVLGLPLVAASVFGGLIASLLQTFIAMGEPSALYAGRLGAIIIALYFLTPVILKSVQDLVVMAVGSV